MQYESLTPMQGHILRKAVDLLNEFGETLFDRHCHENDLSYCDINRCIAKCKFVYNRDDLAERPIPDNLKQARWEHYVKVCRYDDNHARRLLKQIDASYEGGRIK